MPGSASLPARPPEVSRRGGGRVRGPARCADVLHMMNAIPRQARRGALMRATHTRSLRPLAAAALATLLALGGTTTMTATAAAPAPPVNDNYLEALNLNKPGTPPLNRTETLTRRAQHRCGDGPAGHLQPQPARRSAGAHRLQRRQRGQDDLVRLLPQRQRARANPYLGDLRHGHGGHAVRPQDAAARKRPAQVRGQPADGGRRTVRPTSRPGKPYTIQLGGVEAAGGNLQFLFDYVVQLKRLQAEATLTAQPLADGVRVVGLAVSRSHEGPRGSALHARLPPAGQDGPQRRLPRVCTERCCPTAAA